MLRDSTYTASCGPLVVCSVLKNARDSVTCLQHCLLRESTSHIIRYNFVKRTSVSDRVNYALCLMFAV